MTIREFIGQEIDIDVYDDVCEEIAIAFCGPQPLTAEGKEHFAGIMDYEVEINHLSYGTLPAAIVKVDGPDWEEKLAKALADGVDLRNDPARRLYAAIRDVALAKSDIIYAEEERLAEATKAYTAGQMEWMDGQPLYPDANSTCRLSYGTVKSYSPKDGVLYKHYTTLKGVMEKEDPDNYEFRVPAKLKEIYLNKDYGQYANEDGELVTCFLTNNDITGGNSGSPVLNANGELIGLAFDGNWEAMSGDVIFEPNLQRCINVDIRYVLLILDKFGGAGYLLNEMKLVK